MLHRKPTEILHPLRGFRMTNLATRKGNYLGITREGVSGGEESLLSTKDSLIESLSLNLFVFATKRMKHIK